MSLVVVGSIAFDAVKTPFGERERMLGGSAVHFSLAASYFTDVRVVGPVGDDFGEGEYAVLHGRGVNTDDIEHVEGGKTFFWAGEYEWNVNIRHTLDTQLNVFGEFQPKLSEGAKQADVLFLANIQPDLQREVRLQCSAKLAGLDSMNYWIESARDSLVKTIGTVDLILMNDDEVRMLTGEPHAPASRAQDHGARPAGGRRQAGRVRRRRCSPRRLLLAARLSAGEASSTPPAPATPSRAPSSATSTPTAARPTTPTLRRAMTYGSAVASFWVEEFGCERAEHLTRDDIEERYEAFRAMTTVEGVTTG